MTEPQPRWRVVETHFDQLSRITRTIHHTHIGGHPMTEANANAYATQERARYAGARLRRSFHAEPVTATRDNPGGASWTS